MLLTGVDRQAVLAHALSGGAIDRTAETIAGLDHVDLVILAAPVRQNLSLLADAVTALSPSPEGVGGQPCPLMTDVGGTKREIVAPIQTYALVFIQTERQWPK